MNKHLPGRHNQKLHGKKIAKQSSLTHLLYEHFPAPANEQAAVVEDLLDGRGLKIYEDNVVSLLDGILKSKILDLSIGMDTRKKAVDLYIRNRRDSPGSWDGLDIIWAKNGLQAIYKVNNRLDRATTVGVRELATVAATAGFHELKLESGRNSTNHITCSEAAKLKMYPDLEMLSIRMLATAGFDYLHKTYEIKPDKYDIEAFISSLPAKPTIIDLIVAKHPRFPELSPLSEFLFNTSLEPYFKKL